MTAGSTSRPGNPPGMLTKLRAMVAGEVSAETLESYRGAGASVYDLFVQAEHRRSELVGGGKTPWTMTNNEHSYLTAVWIAFALQTLGDAFLQADYDADPGTVGFVPPVTARQAELFYGEVEEWLAAAQRARSDAAFMLPKRIPVRLPEWVAVEPCPLPHLDAMMAACRKIVEHAGVAVADCVRSVQDGSHKGEISALQGEMASLTSSSDYAQSMYRALHSPGGTLHERLESTIKSTIEGAFRIGQIAVMPGAAIEEQTRRQRPPASVPPTRRLPLPGAPGFDLFCLTDPHWVQHFRNDPKAQKALRYLWSRDPSPQATLDIQEEIEAAFARGDISYAKDSRTQQGYCYYCCPWGAIYHVDRETRIGGQSLRPGEEFAYDVSAEAVAEGGDFKREIKVGRFSNTSETDYCDGRD